MWKAYCPFDEASSPQSQRPGYSSSHLQGGSPFGCSSNPWQVHEQVSLLPMTGASNALIKRPLAPLAVSVPPLFKNLLTICHARM